MKWNQIFENALKTGTFTNVDLGMAISWPHCAVGDLLHSRGYNGSYSSDVLGRIVDEHDDYLLDKGLEFTKAVRDSLEMPSKRNRYHSEANYHKACIKLVRKAQKIYDEIQREEIHSDLEDHLELTVTSALSA